MFLDERIQLMSNEKYFKIAIAISVLTSASFYFLTGSYSGDIAYAMEWHGFGSTLPLWYQEITSILWIIIPLLTLSFNSKARTLYAFLVGLELCSSLFSGVAAYTSTEMFLLQASLIADGVALTLSYLVIGHRFAQARTEVVSA